MACSIRLFTFSISIRSMAAFGVLAMITAALNSCNSSSRGNTISRSVNFERQGNLIVIPEGSPLREGLKFETVQVESVNHQLAAPAVVEANPDHYARICPPLAGRIAHLAARLGDAVSRGQLLVTLDSPDYMAAQSDFTKAKSALSLATRTWEREKDLLEHKIVAQRDVEQAQKDLAAAQSDMESATARLRAFGFDPEKDKLGQPLEIRSPISGRVVDLSVTTGEFWNDNNVSLMIVADFSTVWLTASVQEKDIGHLAKGQQVNAVSAAYPDEVLRGKVLFVGDMLDPDTRTVKVRVAFPNPDNRFKPGMFMTMNFESFPANVIMVSTTAVVQIGPSSFVFEQVKPWTLAPREVVLGEEREGRVVIKKGINPGATVLSKEGVLFQ